MIHTNARVRSFKGLNFVIDPKEMMSPKGRDSTRVAMKRRQVTPNPDKSFNVTSKKMFIEKRELR